VPTDVHIFFHKEKKIATSEIRSRVLQICNARGWNCNVWSVSSYKNRHGRSIPLIGKDVAGSLYPRAHRARVAVLVIGTDPKVPLAPDHDFVLDHERYKPLRRFVEYKTFWARLPDPHGNDSWAGEFAGWCQRVECEGDHDPRCLPFHVFDGHGKGLSEDTLRVDFDGSYGHGGRRIDERGSIWSLNPLDFHGTESLSVAGQILRPGCHWDVVGKRWLLSTSGGQWRIDGHVNIYPDAHLRPRGSNVRRIK